MLWQSGLFEHSICGVARLDPAINNEMYLGDRTVPDFVITLSCTHETATRGKQRQAAVASIPA
jgi:hypothetical protein